MEIRHGAIVDNIVTNLCAKVDRLVDRKSDNNKKNNTNNVRGHWGPVSGSDNTNSVDNQSITNKAFV